MNVPEISKFEFEKILIKFFAITLFLFYFFIYMHTIGTAYRGKI